MNASNLRGVVLTLVVVLVVSPFAVYAVPELVGADESYVVLTGSMRPSIAPGDVVVVKAVPASSIGVGDVITFDRGSDVPTTHRVIEVLDGDSGPAFRTQGDANEDPDGGLVTPEQVVGRVVFSVPAVGHVVSVGGAPLGFVALVVVPFGLLVLDLGYSALRRRSGDRAREASAPVARDERPLPVRYDPAVAAAAYARGAAEARMEQARADVESAVWTTSARDMTVSIGVAAVLVLYAAWNAYWQFATLDAPRPETMSVLSGALVGLAMLAYLRFAGQPARPSPGASRTQTDAVRGPDGREAVVGASAVPTVGPEEATDAD
jgi:signal peptidase